MEHPFSKMLSRKNKKVILLGSLHNSDISTLNKIKLILKSFNPEVVLIEGGFECANFRNEEEAITMGADTGYLAFLSQQLNILIRPNDPSFSDCFTFLEKKHNTDFSFLYFFLREKSFYINAKLTISDEIILEKIKSINLDKNFDFSILKVQRIFKNLFHEDISNKDYSTWFDPTQGINIFNQATRELNIFRDNFMIESFIDALGNYDRILLMKGEHHLQKYQKKIKEIIKNEKWII